MTDKYEELRAALSPDVSEITLRRAANREALKALLEERDALMEALTLADAALRGAFMDMTALQRKVVDVLQAAKRQEGS